MVCEEAYKVVSKEKRSSSDGDEEKLEIECLHKGWHCEGFRWCDFYKVLFEMYEQGDLGNNI